MKHQQADRFSKTRSWTVVVSCLFFRVKPGETSVKQNNYV